MKKIFQKVSLFALACTTQLFAVVPYLSYRSQSSNTALEIAGWAQHIDLPSNDENYGTLAVSPGYARSFKSDRILNCLFGDSLVQDSSCLEKKVINISGRQTADRGSQDWLADYFYLPSDFKSTLEFKPRISNIFVDLAWYAGLDRWMEGLYFKVHAPIVRTKWDLQFDEKNITAGTVNHAGGYFNASDSLANTSLLNNAEEYFSGNTITDPVTTTDLTVTYQGLKYAKIVKCSKSDTKLSDIEFALGWNYILEEDQHLGLNVRFVAPTGTRPKAEFLFEPVVGNGHHFGFGGGLTAHKTFWRNNEENKSAGFYIDGTVTHLFKARQKRTFDIKEKNMSRYMLAIKFDTTVTKNLQGGGTTPDAQFANEMAPLANISTADVDVTVGVVGDVTAMFNMEWCNFNWDLGYNYWGRSCEKIKLRCLPFGDKEWALKGDSHVYGYDGTNAAWGVPLSATQSQSTIFTGTNFPAKGTTSPTTQDQFINPNIDNRQLATGDSANAGASNNLLNDAAGLQTGTSVDPILLDPSDCGDLDIKGAQTKGNTHKIFTHVSYNWLNYDKWVPYVGLGAAAEFGSNTDTCDANCSCANCSLTQWQVWAKIGVSY